MRITLCTLIAAAVLFAGTPWEMPALAGDTGYWRLLDCFNKTLEDPNSGYTSTAEFKRGYIAISESGEHPMRGELSWGIGPPDDKLIGGATVPFWAGYFYSGKYNSYGYIFYGFASAPVMQPSWWENSYEAPTYFDTSNSLGQGYRQFPDKSITIPRPPGNAKYMYIGAGAVGQHSVQGFYFMVYEWVEGSPDEPPGAKVKAPCEEAMAFYGVNQLQGLYTGKGSQKFTRDELANQMVEALRRYYNDGNAISDGTKPVHNSGETIAEIPTLVTDPLEIPAPITDALEMARTFDTTGLPTGNEASLHSLVADYAAKQRATQPDYRLTPGDVFYLSLQANRGNIRDALCTCHCALDRNDPANEKLVSNYLCDLRNPEGYTDGEWTFTTESGTRQTINPRSKALGLDQQGVWYHFYGMAALEFADGHNIAPFFATQAAVYAKLNKTKTAKVQRRGLKLTEIGGVLSDFAIALEDATRSSYGAVPDPDKQCINYAGVLAGVKLRALLAKLQSAKVYPDPLRTQQFDHSGPISGEAYEMMFDFRSPLSVKITGTGGEEFSFDQTSKTFAGNTPCVFFLVNPEPDGTWGLTIAPQFKVASMSFTATAAGPGQVAQYNMRTGETRGREFALTPAQVIKADSLSAIAGNATETAVSSSADSIADWKTYPVGSVELHAPPNWEYTAETGEDYPSWTYSEQGNPVAGVMLIENDTPAQAVINGLQLQVTPGQPTQIAGLSAASWSGSWQAGAATVWLYSLLQPLANGHRVHILVVNTVGRETEMAATCASILKQLRIRQQ